MWAASKTLRELKTWKERVDWSWSEFGKASMIVTHNLLTKSLKRTECNQIQFEEFSQNYDAAFVKWMNYWDIAPEAIPILIEKAAAHDLNRLTPEQRAAHNHVSGYSFSKQDMTEVNNAFLANLDLMQTLKAQQKELGY